MTTPASDTPQGPANTQANDQQEIQAASSQQTMQLRDLATALAPASTVSTVTLKGVVTATDTGGSPPTISVQVGGDTSATIAAVRFLDSYSPVVGDTVLILKQGSDLFVLGQMMDSTSGSSSGWTAPSLNSGYTTNGNSNGPLEYRLVMDNGDAKIQWRGSVARTSGGTTIFTMPVGFRPSNKQSLLVARDMQGGSNVEQIDFGTDGTVVRVGSTVGVKASSGAQTGIGGGSAATSSVNPGNTANSTFQGTTTSTATANLNLTDGNTAANHQHFDGVHFHGMGNHSHVGGDHQHPLESVVAPTWIGFNNIEYYL